MVLETLILIASLQDIGSLVKTDNGLGIVISDKEVSIDGETKPLPRSYRGVDFALTSSTNGQLNVRPAAPWMRHGTTIMVEKENVVAKSPHQNPTRNAIAVGDTVIILDDGKEIKPVSGKQFKKGQHLIVDPSGLYVFGQREVEVKSPNAEKVQIAGLDQQQNILKRSIIHPIRTGKLKPSSGIITYGPPGTGKSLISKWLAQEVGLWERISGTEILSQYVGVAEAIITRMFDNAESVYAQTQKTTVLFFDEADAIFHDRRVHGSLSDITNSIISIFLSRTGSMQHNGHIVVLATNRPEMIDPAITRSGRAELQLEIPRPNRVATREIAELYASQYESSCSIPDVIDDLIWENGTVVRVVKGPKVNHGIKLRDLTSGAMIQSIIDESARIANYLDKQLIDREDILEAINLFVDTKHDREFLEISMEVFGYEAVLNSVVTRG